jgi:hypothetical protein
MVALRCQISSVLHTEGGFSGLLPTICVQYLYSCTHLAPKMLIDILSYDCYAKSNEYKGKLGGITGAKLSSRPFEDK